ncbi:Ubiquinol--cytochrome c reductase [Carbonactinospora thermoautotrophica]|uniref:Cytochrome bc1 complex cytochrome b subunit n=1 Tax=Carbonactinospora thermoautotrophica TaxID=1469144 RepID=A0A132MVD8_9ACTN|nr:ubiquinol-cytochrome c reductase cytochrome b subunit [Carbonactinospora thermoautotrophica]KWX01680.1 Ubiquinol--cytochrome c reductase [Carbonactinospora thermoautotrophica]
MTKVGGAAADYLDERVSLGSLLKKNLRKVFPDHWSFLLGEIALYSFVILLLSGVFLTFFFKPSTAEVVYNGSYVPLRGIKMSEAYASTLEISFDVRAGLLMRQIHHWAALFFVAAMTVHMLRVFFTGAFRKPRELNWVIGVTLLILGVVEGFAGYSLPDDLLSGTGLRIASGIILSIPIIGTYVHFLTFGGEFPGHDFIPRLYTVHVLLIPGIILALITAHLILLVYQKHTQYPGPGRRNDNVVGQPLLPVYMAKAGGFFFVVFGVTALLGAIAQINPIWSYGPYTPTQITAGSQPDWYMGWLEGLLRIMPAWEFVLFGYTFSMNVFVPGVVAFCGFIILLALYPFIEAWVTGDKREHHILDRPRNQATRTAIGVAGVTWYGLAWLAGGNDLLATHFHVSINAITWFMRIAIFAGPVLAFIITKRICLGLQRRDREKVLHGRETGIIKRLPHGEFIEVHEPISAEERYLLTQHEVPKPLELGPEYDENGVRWSNGRMSRFRAALSRWYFADRVEKPTAEELKAIESGHGHH